MSQDYGPAIWLGNDQIGYGGWVSDFRPKWIIVHGTDGDLTIEDIQRTFMSNARRGAPSSTTYGIGMDGRSGQYVPEGAPAWGNGPITGPSGHAIAGAGNAHDFWWDQQPHPWGAPTRTHTRSASSTVSRAVFATRRR